MEGQPEFLSTTLILGVILIIAGALLILTPLLSRIIDGLDKVHPLLLLGFRLDGLYIGTSPILIMALILVYLLLRLARG